jgi:hypothetical protein
MPQAENAPVQKIATPVKIVNTASTVLKMVVVVGFVNNKINYIEKMKAYTLKKKEDTEEYHLFEGNLLGIKKCDTNLVKESICKMMSLDEIDGNIFT